MTAPGSDRRSTESEDSPDRVGDYTTGTTHDDLAPTHTRTSAAWTLVAAGAFLALLMVVFILQNSDQVRVHFLMFDASVPLGAALLLASVIGAMTVALLAAGRLLQLRLAARRHRRAA